MNDLPTKESVCFLNQFLLNYRLLLLLLAFFLAVPAAHPQSAAWLPDGPEPTVDVATAGPFSTSTGNRLPAQTAPAAADAKSAGSVAHGSWQQRKWSQYVDPGEHIPPLYARDKWVFWLHQEARPSSALPAFLSAGYGQLTDTPQYGSDSGAFGDRLGAAFLRQATMRFFCSSLFPVMDHEDPRYFRKASGRYLGRAGWAAERALITQRDNGSRGFNFSDVLGHLAASALTLAYYPGPSANTKVVLQTWGTSIAGAAGNNLFLEFWPDAVDAWRRHRQRVHAASSESG